jgi:aminotransferase
MERHLSAQTQFFQTPVLRQITNRVREVGGINLGQGVCNLAPPMEMIEAAERAMRGGINLYTDPQGLPSLREAIAHKLRRDNGIAVEGDSGVLVTCGATGAFEAVCGVLLNPGDKVVVFEPSYPYHLQALKRYQAEVITIPMLGPDWGVDFGLVAKALKHNPKFILVNTPGNPTGKVWNQAELERLADLLEPTDTLLVTDEIYEYMVFDGESHVSPATLDRLKDKTLTMGGFSKTFAITGWRIGFLHVPTALEPHFVRFLDAVYVCPPAPLQQGVAEMLAVHGETYLPKIAAKYQAKRDLFAQGLSSLGFESLPLKGAYYLLASWPSSLETSDSVEASYKLIESCGVGAVPSSDFVRDHHNAPWLRFCLAHDESVLEEALNRLSSAFARL